jgi:hypothetical protein
MRPEKLIARTDTDENGRYKEMYLTGFKDGPAYGFLYEYDPDPKTKKQRKKVRLQEPLYQHLLFEPGWRIATLMNSLPILWNPDDDHPRAEIVDFLMSERFKDV